LIRRIGILSEREDFSGESDMPQKLITELWDYVAQQFRDTISRATPEHLGYRISPKENSVAEIAWHGLGTSYQWSVVLSGATTLEEAITMDPSGLDLLQAARNMYSPGRFPDSMPSNSEVLLERSDEIMALIGAQLAEINPAARSQEYRTWWDARYTGDEVIARILWRLSYCDGQMHLLIAHSARTAQNRRRKGEEWNA